MQLRTWWIQQTDDCCTEHDQIDGCLISRTENLESEDVFLEVVISTDEQLTEGPDAYDWLIKSESGRIFLTTADVLICEFRSIPDQSNEHDRKMAELQVEEHAILCVNSGESTDPSVCKWFVQSHYRELAFGIARAYRCECVEWPSDRFRIDHQM